MLLDNALEELFIKPAYVCCYVTYCISSLHIQKGGYIAGIQIQIHEDCRLHRRLIYRCCQINGESCDANSTFWTKDSDDTANLFLGSCLYQPEPAQFLQSEGEVCFRDRSQEIFRCACTHNFENCFR